MAKTFSRWLVIYNEQWFERNGPSDALDTEPSYVPQLPIRAALAVYIFRRPPFEQRSHIVRFRQSPIWIWCNMASKLLRRPCRGAAPCLQYFLRCHWWCSTWREMDIHKPGIVSWAINTVEKKKASRAGLEAVGKCPYWQTVSWSPLTAAVKGEPDRLCTNACLLPKKSTMELFGSPVA